MYNWLHRHSFQCKRLLPKSSKGEKYLTKSNSWAGHTEAACLFVFSFMFRGIPRSIQMAGLTTSCTVKRKHHSFRASLFISLSRRLQEFWTLVQVCLGSRGFRCQHSHCSIPRNQLQSPSPQTCRSEWCHLRTVHPPLLPDSPTSARQTGGERKKVNTRSGQLLGDGM